MAVGGLVAKEGVVRVGAVGAEDYVDGWWVWRWCCGVAGGFVAGRANSRFPKGMTERKTKAFVAKGKARASVFERNGRDLRMVGERFGGDGDGAVGGEEEANAMALAGVEEVG